MHDDSHGVRADVDQLDVDLAAAIGKLHGIGQKVPDNLLQALRIAVNLPRRR